LHNDMNFGSPSSYQYFKISIKEESRPMQVDDFINIQLRLRKMGISAPLDFVIYWHI